MHYQPKGGVMSQINPTGDRVIVRAISETQTKGGIFIPENATEKSSIGIIVAVGQGKTLENGTRPTTISLSRQTLVHQADTSIEGVMKGAYTIHEPASGTAAVRRAMTRTRRRRSGARDPTTHLPRRGRARRLPRPERCARRL